MKIIYYVLISICLPLYTMETYQQAGHIVLLDHQSYEKYRQKVVEVVEIGESLPNYQNNDAFWYFNKLKQRFENPDIDSYLQLFSEEERSYINQNFCQLFDDSECKEKYEYALNKATPAAWDSFITHVISTGRVNASKLGIISGTVEEFLKENSRLHPEAINSLKTSVIGLYLLQIKRANLKPQLQS